MKEITPQYYFTALGEGDLESLLDQGKFCWSGLMDKAGLLKFSESLDYSEKIGETTIIGPVRIGRRTIIHPHVYIEGPVIIGENCLIRSGAWIRPGSIIGDNCVVGHGVELKNAIILSEAKLGSNVFAGDSILGRGARLGSGVVTGNRRFDQQEIKVKVGDQLVATGMDKFGCVIGDYSRVGANATVSPGSLIGPHTWIYSEVLVKGFIPGHRLVKIRQQLEIIDKAQDIILQDKDLKKER